MAVSEVERWVAGEMRTLGSAQWAMLAPRYPLEGGFDGEHWSADELREILGETLEERADGLYTPEGRCVARASMVPSSILWPTVSTILGVSACHSC